MSADLGPKLGKPVSPLAFGVMQFGGKADAAASRAMFDQAREAGITLFDAAYVYTDGAAETLLGEFAEGDPELTLISKCAYAEGMSGDEIRAQARESLKRLRRDRIDILYLHRYPGDDHLDETLEAMRDLYAEGVFNLMGVSNFAAWQVMKAQARAAAPGGGGDPAHGDCRGAGGAQLFAAGRGLVEREVFRRRHRTPDRGRALRRALRARMDAPRGPRAGGTGP